MPRIIKNVLIISANNETAPEPVYPLGAALVATACRKAGYTVDFFDCNFQTNYKKKLKDKLDSFKPDIIGISLRNVDDVVFPIGKCYLKYYRSLINICRKFSCALIVLGGSGFSLFPVQIYAYLKPDYGITGDGEEGMIFLLESLRQGNCNQKIIRSENINYVNNLLMADRDFFDMNKYLENGAIYNMQSKRGCAFNCSYCSYPYIEGHKIRMSRIENTIRELEYLVYEKQANFIFFVDSVFNHPEEHALSICREIVKRNIKISWSAYVRPCFKNPDTIRIFKESGCHSLELGTDSMSEKTLKSLNKQLSIKEISNFCLECQKNDIDFCHSLMFGSPGETMDTIQETVYNVLNTDPMAAIALLGIRVLPHTEIARFCYEKKLITETKLFDLKPYFYIDEKVKNKIIKFFHRIIAQDSRWIVPGIDAFNKNFLLHFRQKKYKGLMWEVKKYKKLIK